jgi:hypothetical protein
MNATQPSITITAEKVYTITIGKTVLSGMREIGRISLAVEFENNKGEKLVLCDSDSPLTRQYNSIIGIPGRLHVIGGSPDLLHRLGLIEPDAEKGGA